MKDGIDPDKQKVIKDWLGTGSINLFGPPFAGKDTQGQKLTEVFSASLIGGGDIIRNSVVPDHLLEIVALGKLMPIKEYIKTVLPYFRRPEFRNQPLILSAVGRWHGEEEGVVRVASQSGHPLKVVIYLRLDKNLMRQRWQRHQEIRDRGIRRDDSAEAFEIRLDEFKNKTLPVIDFYRNMRVLIEVNGDQPPEKVLKDIIDKLFEFAKAQARSL